MAANEPSIRAAGGMTGIRRSADSLPHAERLVEEATRYGPISRMKLLLALFVRHRRIGQVLLWGIFGPPMYLFTRLCMWLDLVFYPRLRTLELTKPVFILGHPRSGSTFLQRAVHRSGRATMFKTWELWFPSLVQRKLVRPVLQLLRLLDMDVLQGSEYGHEIRLDGVEEDEGLFLHQLDSEMLTFVCPQSVTDREFGRIGLQFGRLSDRQTRRSIRFYKACLKRQVVWTGVDRPVVKCNPSVFRIPWILEVFPDARFIYLYRHPQASIRSFLALNQRHVAPILSPWEERDFYRGKYRWSVDLFRAFCEFRTKLTEEQLLVLRFTELTEETASTLRRVFAFAQIEPPAAYWQAVAATASSKRRHRNPSLSEFGVRPEEIEQDLSFLRGHQLNTG